MKTKFFYLLKTLFTNSKESKQGCTLSTGVRTNLIETTDHIKQIEVHSPIYIESVNTPKGFRPFIEEVKHQLN